MGSRSNRAVAKGSDFGTDRGNTPRELSFSITRRFSSPPRGPGENVEKLFALIARVRRAARARIGTGVLNRLLRAAFNANPPPMVSGRRLKLFYATQGEWREDERQLRPPEFVLFVNEPRLLSDTYRRYLEARIRQAQPYPGLPVLMTCRPRAGTPKSSRGRRLRAVVF